MTENNSPLISIVIPAYNVADVVHEQLDALREQLGAPDFEVLVCDNNSKDGTAQHARAASAGLRLRVIDAHGPASASFARNIGAAQATGEFLLFCDADDLVNDRWVASMYSVLVSHDRSLVVSALHHERFNDPTVLDAYGIGPDPAETGLPVNDRSAPGFAGYLPTVAGGGFGIRREHYLQLGGMDASFPGGSEETDFAWRAQLSGLTVLSVPEAVVHYRLRQDARGLFRQQRIQQKARVLLWTRYRDRGMTGPSARYSILELMRELPVLLTSRDRPKKLRAARVTGGHLGALQGMLLYRLLGRLPARSTMSATNAGGSAA